ncbi:hypothetical protein BAY1663_04921 [Pseudomonas sp. BAY1663]|nr:hypothetical protein BAY1663_04921 [Pseudomonas sp. BAY1663]
MAAGGAHAQMVPVLVDADAGAVAVHQPGADQRVGIVAARPDQVPGQAVAAGGIDLAPAQPPAVGAAPGEGRRQAAAGRRAEFRLDPQGVDQRAALHRIQRQAPLPALGPARVGLHARMLQVLHDQDQRSGRLAPGHRRDHPTRLVQPGAGAAEALRHGQCQQAEALQLGEILPGEFAAAIQRLGTGGEALGQPGQHAFVQSDGAHCPARSAKALANEASMIVRVSKALGSAPVSSRKSAVSW